MIDNIFQSTPMCKLPLKDKIETYIKNPLLNRARLEMNSILRWEIFLDSAPAQAMYQTQKAIEFRVENECI